MNPAVKGFLGLWINVSLANQTTEGGLNVGTGAAETIVKVEMAKGRIEVVAPKQADHTAA